MKKALLELFLFGLLFMCMVSSILPSTFTTKVVENVIELINVCSSAPEKPQTSLCVASAPEQTTNQPEESVKAYQKVTPTPKANRKVRSVHKKKSKSYTKKSYGGQCAATTKRGTRCSRSASSGSIYCWQHQ